MTVGFDGGNRGGGAGTIVFGATPMTVGETLLPKVTARQILVARVVSARFSYFGSPAEGLPTKWYDEWTAAARLPRLVALRAGVDLGRRTESVELAFRVFAE